MKGENMTCHDGHRERMRQRYLRDGLETFQPHEALELLLYFAIPRRDTNPLAHDLIERYHTLSGVLSAPPEELMQTPGLGENAALLISLVSQMGKLARVRDAEIILNSKWKAGEYLVERFANERNEIVLLLCLNRKGRLLSCRQLGEGGLSHATLDVRRMAECALLSSAASVILSHNHPSGIALPSGEDYCATDRAKAALDALGIKLWDHIIVAGRDYVSLRESGFL